MPAGNQLPPFPWRDTLDGSLTDIIRNAKVPEEKVVLGKFVTLVSAVDGRQRILIMSGAHITQIDCELTPDTGRAPFYSVETSRRKS